MTDDFTHEVTPSFEAQHEMPLVAVPTPPIDGRSTGPWRPGMTEADLNAMPSDAVVGLMNVRRGLDPVSFEALMGAVAAWIETGTDHACEGPWKPAIDAGEMETPCGSAAWPATANSFDRGSKPTVSRMHGFNGTALRPR